MTAGWGDRPDVTEAAAEKLRQEVARDRLHTRVTGSLPLDVDRAKIELTEEERVRRWSRPKSRRWRGLGKLDDKIDELTRRLEVARQERNRAEERVQAAPEADARSLAAWIAGGERGKRPEATLYERQRERDAAQLTVDALQRTLDEALEERLRYVERHRGTMLSDARKDVEARRARLLAYLQELPALRQELLDARDVLTWIATYPDHAEQYGFPTALALGLREPVERTLETKARVDVGRVVAALEADADALAERYHAQVQRVLGTAPPRTPLAEAMWAEDEDYKKWQRGERDRARKLAEMGRDLNRLAAEVRE
jgi:hypothetical protein